MSRTLNRDPKYMSGKYSKQFNIEAIPSNEYFVKNSYQPGKCECGDMVCFSLVQGALPCKPDKTKMLVYNTEGKLVAVPVKHNGSVSSKNT